MCGTRGFLAWRGWACVLAALVSCAACMPAAWRTTQVGSVRRAEPAATAAFLSAYAGADEVAAERAASPLYAAEWARRGLSARDRAAMEPHPSRADGSGAPWIFFRFLGGAADGRGFLHLLYAGHASCDEVCHGPEVWRVDAEPSGQVIWLEMVWLFTDDVGSLVTSGDAGDVPWQLLPRDFIEADPRVVLAVRAPTGPEAYYELSMRSRADAITFFALGPEGDVRPGAWSYGAPGTSVDPYGRVAAPATQRLPPGQEALRQSYVQSLP